MRQDLVDRADDGKLELQTARARHGEVYVHPLDYLLAAGLIISGLAVILFDAKFSRLLIVVGVQSVLVATALVWHLQRRVFVRKARVEYDERWCAYSDHYRRLAGICDEISHGASIAHEAAMNEEPWVTFHAPPECRRMDVFGGTPESWRYLLASHCSSLLGHQEPVVIVDLAESRAYEPLVNLTQMVGLSTSVHELPEHEDMFDVLSFIEMGRLAATLAEAFVSAGRESGQADNRGIVTRILEDIIDQLGGAVTLARLDAALHSVLGQRIPEYDGKAAISETEEMALGRLFADEYRQSIGDILPRTRGATTSLAPRRITSSCDDGAADGRASAGRCHWWGRRHV